MIEFALWFFVGAVIAMALIELLSDGKQVQEAQGESMLDPDPVIFYFNGEELKSTVENRTSIKPSETCTRVRFSGTWADKDFTEKTRCTGTPVSWSPYNMCEDCAKEEQARCYLDDK